MTSVARSSTLRRVAASFEGSAGEIADEITDRIHAEIAELRTIDDSEFWTAVRESSMANIETGLAVLAGRSKLPKSAPVDAGAAARVAARAGVSLASFLRAYRIAHAVIWGRWLARVEQFSLPDSERTALLEEGSQFLFEFVDRVTTLVTDEFTRERQSHRRSREQRRVELVRDVLEGAAVDPTELNYDLTLEHVGVVAWGGAVDRFLVSVADGLERRLLAVDVGEDVVWAWFGDRRALTPSHERALRELTPPAGVALALGDPASGLGGFRRTHWQARNAYGVALRSRERVVHFDDVALEALALRDERAAREFVERELRAIAGQDDRARTLRTTLRAYFAAGHNASAAAAELGVHEQTITNRLRTVEARLGRPPAMRRAELEAALRLHALLAPQDDDDASRT